MRNLTLFLLAFGSAGVLTTVSATFDARAADTPPRMIHSHHFAYPDETGFARDHYTGYVRARVQIDETGSVTDYVITYATHSVFADAAAEGLLKTPFEPAMRDGQPIPVRTPIQLLFQQQGVRNITALDTVEDRTRFIIQPRYGGFELTDANRLDRPLELEKEPDRYIPLDDDGNVVEGSVRMEYYIDHTGKPRLPRPLGEAHPTLIEFALRSIESMEYEAPVLRGQPVPVHVTQTFSHERRDET